MKRLALVVLLALSLPGVALASSEAGEGAGLGRLFWEITNLVLLLGVLIYFARKPIRGYFGQRRGQIHESLEGSARLLAEAEGRMNEWQAKLERLDAETVEIAANARRQAERERERILADARAAAERIRKDGQSAVEQEVRRARAALREEASDLAIELAERMLRQEVTAADRERLVDEFVARIEQTASGSAR
jgi:F-type H+-transporting ATPase subunit b